MEAIERTGFAIEFILNRFKEQVKGKLVPGDHIKPGESVNSMDDCKTEYFHYKIFIIASDFRLFDYYSFSKEFNQYIIDNKGEQLKKIIIQKGIFDNCRIIAQLEQQISNMLTNRGIRKDKLDRVEYKPYICEIYNWEIEELFDEYSFSNPNNKPETYFHEQLYNFVKDVFDLCLNIFPEEIASFLYLKYKKTNNLPLSVSEYKKYPPHEISVIMKEWNSKISDLKLMLPLFDTEEQPKIINKAKDILIRMQNEQDVFGIQEYFKKLIKELEILLEPQPEPEQMKTIYPSNQITIQWNENSNVLTDIFKQLKQIYNKHNEPVVGNSIPEIAVFLKSNFSCFENTKLSTIETMLKYNPNTPKTSRRITIEPCKPE